jgi:hypothetical protein
MNVQTFIPVRISERKVLRVMVRLVLGGSEPLSRLEIAQCHGHAVLLVFYTPVTHLAVNLAVFKKNSPAGTDLSL